MIAYALLGVLILDSWSLLRPASAGRSPLLPTKSSTAAARASSWSTIGPAHALVPDTTISGIRRWSDSRAPRSGKMRRQSLPCVMAITDFGVPTFHIVRQLLSGDLC
jgi:hypothetical protein